MRSVVRSVVIIGLFMGAGDIWASTEHHHDHAANADREQAASEPQGEQTVSGEVVDTFCYLSHGKEALGKGHADCAKKCINSGLPVAIKVGDQLYIAAMANHEPANKTLSKFAGDRVTVHGTIMEHDGQRLIAITKVEKAQ